MTVANKVDSSGPQLGRKEWREPQLRKLPIAATGSSEGKGNAINSSDGSGHPKSADSHGQFS